MLHDQTTLFDTDVDPDEARSTVREEAMAPSDGSHRKTKGAGSRTRKHAGQSIAGDGDEIVDVPVAMVGPNPWQPRRSIDESELSTLAESIVENGLIQPIVIRRTAGASSAFEIVVGERRWRAFGMLGREKIPAIVRDIADHEMPILALTENLRRADLSDFEISLAIERTDKEFQYRKELADMLGIARGDLYRYLSFKKLPSFVIEDLRVEPHLLGRKSASSVVSAITKHGEKALGELPALWDRVKAGKLSQGKLPETLRDAALRSRREHVDRLCTELYKDAAKIGSIVLDEAQMMIRIKRSASTDHQIETIGRFVAGCFSPETSNS